MFKWILFISASLYLVQAATIPVNITGTAYEVFAARAARLIETVGIEAATVSENIIIY